MRTGVTGRWSRSLATVAAMLLLAGCTSLLTGPAPDLYRLTPKSTYPADLPHVSAQLLINQPLAPAGLDTQRIALSRSPVSLDYFADSEWTDRMPLLVQTALLDSFENSGTITAIDRESIGLHADFILKLEIRHFEAVYGPGNGPPTVWASMIGRLVAMPARKIIAQQAFEWHEVASAKGIPSVVGAFDGALGKVMKKIVVWTVTNPAVSGRRR